MTVKKIQASLIISSLILTSGIDLASSSENKIENLFNNQSISKSKESINSKKIITINTFNMYS